MRKSYTATIYYEEEIIAYKQGEDADELYIWLLIQATRDAGNPRGEVVDDETKTVVKQFCKTPME